MQDFSSSFTTTKKEDQSGTSNFGSSSSMDIKKYLTWMILGLLAIGLGSFVYSWIANPMTITVVGVGEVSAPVTNVAYSFNVSQIESDPLLATEGVKSRIEVLRNLLKGYGTPDSDIVESQVTVVPYNLIVAGSSGYQATVAMAAKLSNTSDSAQVVSQLYENGASLVSQPVITADNVKDLEQEAYDMALADAKTKGNKMAMNNWKFVRKITSIMFSNTATATSVSSKEGGASLESALPTNVIKINKAVNVTFSLW